MIKVYISPDYSVVPKSADNGGIRRVCEAQIKHLPKYEIEIVHRPEEAHIICNHGASTVSHKNTPIVNVNHGMMWSRQPWGLGYQEVNEQLVESMAMSVALTAPSEWVAAALRRGGYWYPEVVYHGIDRRDFSPGNNNGYVLWNKARADYVSDPSDMQNVAKLLPDVRFMTTIGMNTSNVTVLGAPLSHDAMKTIVSEAGIYLGTTRETFGIGTLEAMACGVPIAGFDWGGTKEIIIQGETGYLAPPGDFKALAECIRMCIAERDRLSVNCIDDVKKRWKWGPRIKQYADIFKRVYRDFYETEKPLVSVIVTAYKLDQFLPAAIESVQRQTIKDWELIVVDDAQLDSTRKIVESYARNDKRITYRPTLENLGLPGARNYGLHLSRGRYIRHLDADDFLDKNALRMESDALNNNPGIHIAYGHLEVVNEDGTRRTNRSGEPERCGWPPNQFCWEEQMAHLNQLPSCVMMRREVMERTGGYRDRMRRQEDADFWCRSTSGGFRARKITQAVTYFHRERGDSKGAMEWKTEGQEPDWTAWFPWRMGAGDFSRASSILKRFSGRHPNPPIVPFGSQGRPRQEKLKFWYIHDYAYPVVSIVITVGPHHKEFMVDALDSVLAQTYPDWECIVVNDTGKPWDENIPGAPWAKVVNMRGNCGTSAARNEGYKHTRAPLIVWMDADDYWLPWYLEVMIAHAEINKDGVIFSDVIIDENGKKTVMRYDKFDIERVPKTMQYAGSSVIVPRSIVDAVIGLQGGFDTKTPGMEDWDYQMAVHHLGFCAYRVDEPLFVYRLHTTTKREADYAKIDQIREYMDKKWQEYRTGEKKLMCGCRKTTKTSQKPLSTFSSSGNFSHSEKRITTEQPATTMIDVEYVGSSQQTFSIRSRVQAGLVYRFGNNPGHKRKSVFLGDAEFLTHQLDANGRPLYVVLANSSLGARDPAAFLGSPISL